MMSTLLRVIPSALRRHVELLLPLIRREISGRYRGSALGLLWSFINPLFMLLVFTFVFGAVFKSRWGTASGGTVGNSMTEFSIILFAGLTVFQFFSEVVSRAPTLILANTNYVKKIVFPLQILPVVAVGSALFHAMVSFVLLLLMMAWQQGSIPATVWLLPIAMAPLVFLTLGLAWVLASLGTYLRDINQLIGSLVTALMFLSGVFFPRQQLPEWIQPWVLLSPVAIPIEAVRDCLVFGNVPDAASLAIHTAISLLVAVAGYHFFQKTRMGFSDVV